MTKHLTDTLQQRHLVYINAVPTGGRAETAPALSALGGEDERYFLGTIHEEIRLGILKKHESEFGSRTSEAAPSDALRLRNAADSAARVGRRKRVSFAPLSRFAL